MLASLLTSWWFYIPIIAVLVFLTRRNNQKILQIKATQNQHTDTVKSTPKPKKPRKQSAKLTKLTGKLGLQGASKHLRRK